jgi:membrane protease YdiL (CAAX protease family)
MTPPVALRPELRLPGRVLLIAVAAWLGASVLLGIVLAVLGVHVPRDETLFSPWLEGGQLAAYAVLAGLTWWGAQRSSPDPAATLGLVRPVRWRRALALVGLAWVTLIAIEAVLEPILHGGESQGLKPTAVPHALTSYAGVALGFLAVVVAAPIVEELFFRGAVYGWARPRFGPVATALGSAVVFAAFHLQPRAFPVLALVGLASALIYEETGSIAPGMVLHALFNGPAFVFAFLSS